MPDARTTATELGTALGMLGYQRLEAAVADRSPALDIDDPAWDELAELVQRNEVRPAAEVAFTNGGHFLNHPGGLGGRRPRLIEWTGGRRSPGDEVVPADLLVDRVLLVSCKYRSRVLHNAAPGRLFDELLMAVQQHRRPDWYSVVAHRAHQDLLDATLAALGQPRVAIEDLDAPTRRAIRTSIRSRPEVNDSPEVITAYRELTTQVSAASAQRWRARLSTHRLREKMLWRLLRIYSAPYFVLGHDRSEAVRSLIGTPWDWRRRYQFEDLDISAGTAGQPTVDWLASYADREAEQAGTVKGHVEVRWSHGRFGQPPEAKVYLDTPHAEVPGYQALDDPTS